MDPRPTSLDVLLNASGYVTTRLEATVSSKITGKVAEILIEEGMKVEKGQILAKLDSSNVIAGLRLAEAQLASSKTNLAETARRQHVAAALEAVGLSHRAKHHPRTLSGGEQQRVGIARAIVTDPTVLLCDEPTGDLDRKSGDEILSLLQTLNQQHGKTIIMVTHDPHASAKASRTVYLDKGQLSNKPLE